MTREQVEEILRSQPDPREGEYRPRPLPMTIEPARRAIPAAPPRYLQMAAAGVAGAVVALALIAAGSATGLFAPSPNAGNPQGLDLGWGRPCRSADFELRTEAWPNAPMAGGVLVIFEGRETADCVIDRGFYASVVAVDGEDLGAAAISLRDAVDVEPGMALQAGVYWSTYCGTAGGTVAAPVHPARPLTLSVGLMVDGGDLEGVKHSVPDARIQVETQSEIAPEPCLEEYPGSPFWLGLTGLETYPGPPPE